MATAALAFAALTIAAMIATEVVRGVVDAARRRRRGFGGTQDVLLWGALIMVVGTMGTITCLVIWAMNRS